MNDSQLIPVIDRFLLQADLNRDRPAMEGLSYLGLARQVCGLSSQLSGARVLIACKQGPNAYAAMLASLHAGKTYAPINVEAPIARQLLICEQFQPDVVIGDETTPLALRGERFLTVGAETDPFSAQNSNAPAYVIFTSGSTGVPKGVVISRHAMDHYINWVIPALGLTPDARVSQHPNIGFDFSVMDIFGSLASGAQLFPIVTLKDRLFPVDAIQRLKLTHWISVPSVVDLMFRGKGAQLGDLPDLEQMVFCGEPLLPHHLDKLFRVAPGLRVMNTYGPTEATVSVTSLQLNRENWSEFSDSSIALGEAIPGMAITLAGENPNEGEIIISGPQVADGYWRDPERTANAFKGKSYRTGDWAKRIRGSLYFCERIDRQVKWLGHRIELGEIDNELQAATGNLAVTILQADGLVGVVEATDVDPSAIQRALRQKLPDYMIPARIVAIEMLPRNLNDKIDHAAIAALLQ